MELPKSYLSASQINMYLRCPLSYYYRYVEGLIIPPGSSLTKGKAVHSGVEFNYKQKLETKKDLPVNQILEYTSAEFDSLAEETQWDMEKGKAKDETIKLTQLYCTEISPKVQPVAVEEKVEVTFDNADYTLLGYIDVIDDKGFVRDTKTTGRTPSESVIVNNLQLAAYSLAHRQLRGTEESGVVLDYLVNTKEPKVVQLKAKYQQQQIDRFLKILGIVAHNIKYENFYPNPNNNLCGPKTCGFYQICKEW